MVNPELSGRIPPLRPGDTEPTDYCKLEVEAVFKNINDNSIVDVSDLQQSDFSIENGTIQGLAKDGSIWKLAARSNSGHTGLIRVKLNAKQDRWEEREQVFRATDPISCQPAAATELNSLVVTDHTINFVPTTTEYTLDSTVSQITIEAATAYTTSTVEIIPQDTDDSSNGHQATLVEGSNSITLTVTVQNGDTQVYTLIVNTPQQQQQVDSNEPITVSVEDEEAYEGTDPSLDFEIKLNRPATEPQTIYYSTIGNTATAGLDFTSITGKVTFNAGEQIKTISVPVLDDNIDEGEENLVFLVVNLNTQQQLQATGTIYNSDVLPKAWIARYGHIIAGQISDAIWRRIDNRTTDNFVNLGGQTVNLDGNDTPPETEPELGLKDQDLSEKFNNDENQPEKLFPIGPIFNLSNEKSKISLWGEYVQDNFTTEVDSTSIEGKVDSTFVGIDFGDEEKLYGIIVGYSEGIGTYLFNENEGELYSSMYSVYPYWKKSFGSYDLWLSVGYGNGTLKIDNEMGELKTKLNMYTGLSGLKKTLIESGDYNIDIRSDAFIQKIKSDKTEKMEGADATTYRLRLLLNGDYRIPLSTTSAIIPNISTGLRHDGGDIEKATGVELNVGMTYESEALQLNLSARRFFTGGGYSEWGYSGNVSYEKGERGPYAQIQQNYGEASDNSDSLWQNGVPFKSEFDPQTSQTLEFGYKFLEPKSQGIITPYYKTDIKESWSTGLEWALKDITFDIKYEENRRDRLIYTKFKIIF